MEHALAATTGEAYDHSNDLGMGGGPKMDGIGSREQDYVTLYNYLDANFPGRYIKDWEPFDHPQLGPVEIGGVHSTESVTLSRHSLTHLIFI